MHLHCRLGPTPKKAVYWSRYRDVCSPDTEMYAWLYKKTEEPGREPDPEVFH